MSKETAFLCLPEDFKKKFLIFPPKVKEIASNKEFSQYSQLFTISQEELEDEFFKQADRKDAQLKVPTPFEYLLANSYHDKNFEKMAKSAFYFFIRQKVDFLYEKKLILIGDLKKEVQRVKSVDELVFLDEGEYFEFQNKIREALGANLIEPPNPNEHPKIKAMKAKARYRDKIKAKQGGGINFITSLAAICCMEIGITPLNIGEMSYASMSILMNTYQGKEKYHIDIGSLQAGADSKKVKPKYWITNLN